MTPGHRVRTSPVPAAPGAGPAGPDAGRIGLRRELSAFPGRIAFALLLALAATAAALAVPLIVKAIITRYAAGAPLYAPVLWLCAVAVAGAVAKAGSGFLLARTGEHMIYRLRARIMEHALRLPVATVRAQGSGDLTARVTSDALLLRQVVDLGAQLPLAALTVTFTLGMMVWIDWVLTVVTVVSLAITAAGITLIVTRVKTNVTGQQAAIGRLAQRFTSSLDAVTTIKAYRAEGPAARSLERDAEGLRSLSLRGARLESLIPPVMSLGNQFAMIAVILTGGARMTAGALSVSDFAAFMLYLFQTISPATALAQGVGRVQAGLAARDRCNELLALVPESAPLAGLRTPDPLPRAPAVELDAVSYTHPGSGTPALSEVSFTVARQGLTAVVGPSGAGKTTVLSLIDRFAAPQTGRITVLGHDSGSWPLDALRARITYVDQTFTLLEETVRGNLQLGRATRATEAELAAVLDAVGLTQDVAALPHGLDTMLGREFDLSGGQRQRMALARALLCEAEIVLLDEPTSQLDGLNEQRFRDIVDDLALRRAVVVVAHRLSTVQHARHVVMMSGGTVLDAADHPTLMSRCGPYRELVSSQAMADSAAAPRVSQGT